MIAVIAILTLTLIGITAVYFIKQKNLKPEKYIWVGQGKDPFSKD